MAREMKAMVTNLFLANPLEETFLRAMVQSLVKDDHVKEATAAIQLVVDLLQGIVDKRHLHRKVGPGSRVVGE